VALEETAAALRSALEQTNAAREDALKISREVIQFASRAIRAVHRGEREAAQKLVEQAKSRVEAVKQTLAPFPELYWAGYVHDSQKEYVEAEMMLAIVSGTSLPSADALGVEPAAYLNGMAEAASESRRHALDLLRTEQFDRANAVFRVMEEIYDELVTFDFPDAITGGLRRTTDALRAVLERTRADLTLTLNQKRLEIALKNVAPETSGAIQS
jgi:translin